MGVKTMWCLTLILSTASGLKLRQKSETKWGLPALPNWMWTPLWTQFETTCVYKLAGVELTTPVAPVSLISMMNHNLCYEAETISDLCDCRPIERHPTETYSELEWFYLSYNKTLWSIVSGKVCKEHSFDTPGQAMSLYGSYKGCNARVWQTEVRLAFFETWRWPWQRWLAGHEVLQTACNEMAANAALPFTLFLPGSPDIHINTYEEMVGCICDNFPMLYCNGPNGEFMCGPQGRDRGSIKLILCQKSEGVAFVRDVITAYNSRNASDFADASGLIMYTRGSGKWKFTSMGAAHLPPEYNFAKSEICHKFPFN